MGQKVNPHGQRVGVNQGWDAAWYADKKLFSANLLEDHKIRDAIKTKFFFGAISKITIERAASTLTVNIFSGRPGLVISNKTTYERPAPVVPVDGETAPAHEKTKEGITIIKDMVKAIAPSKSININVIPVKSADTDAQLLAESIADSLEKRKPFRRALKEAMRRCMTSNGGAKGIKTMVSGRLDGAEIARSEHYHEGSIPLQTLRADIDYGFAQAKTTYGILGVKVWVYKGEIFRKTLKGGND